MYKIGKRSPQLCGVALMGCVFFSMSRTPPPCTWPLQRPQPLSTRGCAPRQERSAIKSVYNASSAFLRQSQPPANDGYDKPMVMEE
jgi:hypothetical protein